MGSIDRFGRRASVFFGAAFITLGGILTSSANHRSQLLAGRFVLGFGSG